VHPGKNGQHQLYLMCTNLEATMSQLKARGATFKPEMQDERWGRLATLVLPGGSEVSI
jgi:predicted enzyme related to lactoylglutathione lyase